MKLLALFLLLAVGVSTAEKVVCYFSSWAVYRSGEGKFDVDNIDPYLCTHLIFNIAGLSNVNYEIEVLDPWNELCAPEPGGNNCAYKRFVELKKKNPSLTVLLAIGGWNEGSQDYSRMASDPVKRSTFIQSAVNLLTKQGFDGLDFMWEYPTLRGGVPDDKANFVTLLQELRSAFDKVSPTLKLTASVSAIKDTIDSAYDIKNMVPSVEQFHVMTYDYHGCYETYTHHNAPLCGYYEDTGAQEYFNVNASISYLIQLGVPNEKLILGAAIYGRCYKLDSILDHEMMSPTHQCGAPGPYSQTPGILASNELCMRLSDDHSCTVVHDPNLYEPYFYCTSDNIWCGYDDADSLYIKARYAKNMGLGGVAAFSMDEDDFRAQCYEETSHLIKSMKTALKKPAGGDVLKCGEPLATTTEGPYSTRTTPKTEPTQEPTPEPTFTPITTSAPVTTHVPVTTPRPEPTTLPVITTTPHGGRPDCTGLPIRTKFPHLDCNKYWECINTGAILEMCAPGTLYDRDLTICNWESAVETTDCRYWTCQVEGTTYPALKCSQYFRCVNGAPLREDCNGGLYWNQAIKNCDDPIHVDTSLCNP